MADDADAGAGPDAAADPCRRRRARGGLAPDGVQRRQQPRPAAPRHALARVQEAIDELGYSPNRAARNLRTRTSHLIGLRFTPAQEGTANALMDRFVHSLVETSSAAGYHVLLFPGDPRTRSPGTTTCCARPPSTPSWPPTPTSATRRPPGWSRAGRRSSRSAGRGTTPTPATRGSTSTAPPAPSSPPPTCSSAATSGSPGSAGARTPGSARTAAPAGAGRCATAGLATTGLASRVEDTVASGREASAVLLDEASPTGFVCASDTLAMGVLHTLADRGLVAGPRRRRRRLRRLPGRPGGAARADARCASRSRRSRSRS